MNLKMMNESFKRKYSNTLNEAVETSDKEALRKALVLRSMNVVANGGNIKALEVALQDVIENFYPDHCWWEVTDCQIFNELFMNGVNPRDICDLIVDQLKPEFAGTSEAATESLEEDTQPQKLSTNSKGEYLIQGNSDDTFQVFNASGVHMHTFSCKDAERAKAKFGMGDKKSDPGFDDDMDESLLTEDSSELYSVVFFKPFVDPRNDSDATKRFKHLSAEKVKELVAKGKQVGLYLGAIETSRGQKVDGTEFDPEYDAEAVKLAYHSIGTYNNMTGFYKTRNADLTRHSRNNLDRRVNSVTSANPLAIRAVLNAAIQNMDIISVSVTDPNGREIPLDAFNKLADTAMNCKFKDAAIKNAQSKLKSAGFDFDSKLLTTPIKPVDPNAAPKKQDDAKPLNVFNDRGVKSDRPLNASFDRHTVKESFSQYVINKLHEHLSRLNEAEMSDEDKHDSELIRSMIAKLEKRSNARFTPEEQAVMDKYGFTRDNWAKVLRIGDRELNPSYDGKERKVYGSHDDWRGHYVRNGNPSKINYADRARKLKGRQFSGDTQVSGRYSPNGAINAHTQQGGYTLQDVERAAVADRDKQPVDTMRRHLRDRDYYQHQIDGAQAEYDRSVGAARKTYDDSVRWATDTYRRHTVDAEQSKKRADDEIDKMLRRK